MPILEWDKTGEKLYETGVENGVLYPQDATGAYPLGVAWNGLSSVGKTPSGGEATAIWASNKKYLSMMSAEEFGGSIEAYMYPDEFAVCNGEAVIADGVSVQQQTRKTFGLCFKTLVGNDVLGNDYGYKLHLVYGCKVSPSEQTFNTINDSPEAATMSWEYNTTPVKVTGFKPTACLVIESKKVPEAKMLLLLAELYGSATETAHLLLPDEVAAIVGTTAG